MSHVMTQIRTLAGTEVVRQKGARRALAVTLFAVATALSAHAAVPIPGTAVPISMQTLVVSLAGLLLGARLGALSQALYLMAGIAGLPVFANGAFGMAYLMGPTGGYLLAFPAAAAATGWLAQRARDDGSWAGAARLLGAIFLATLVVFAGGWAQLTLLVGDPRAAFALGVAPFVVGDVLKSLLALLVARRLRKRTLGLL
ncbi:MAG: biotin transporter BioY [Gemmatimonadota bacterium]